MELVQKVTCGHCGAQVPATPAWAAGRIMPCLICSTPLPRPTAAVKVDAGVGKVCMRCGTRGRLNWMGPCSACGLVYIQPD